MRKTLFSPASPQKELSAACAAIAESQTTLDEVQKGLETVLLNFTFHVIASLDGGIDEQTSPY